MESIKIRKFTKKHKSAVMLVAQSTFGAGYFDEVIKAHPAKKSLFLIATVNNAVVGFVLARMLAKDDAKEVMRGNYTDLPIHIKLADNEGRLAIIQSIAVQSEFQWLGIGRALVCSAEDDLILAGGKVIIVPAWKFEESVNIANLMNSTGYNPCTELLDYWKTDCDSGVFSCPVREDKCICAIIFYYKANLFPLNSSKKIKSRIRQIISS